MYPGIISVHAGLQAYMGLELHMTSPSCDGNVMKYVQVFVNLDLPLQGQNTWIRLLFRDDDDMIQIIR